MLVDAPEGYGHLWAKSLAFLSSLVAGRSSRPGEREGPQYVMHADDDSFVRLDLLLPLLRAR